MTPFALAFTALCLVLFGFCLGVILGNRLTLRAARDPHDFTGEISKEDLQ